VWSGGCCVAKHGCKGEDKPFRVLATMLGGVPVVEAPLCRTIEGEVGVSDKGLFPW